MRRPRYIALLESNNYLNWKAVPVPEGQSLNFDKGTITRVWLHHHIEGGWHLVGFFDVEAAGYNEIQPLPLKAS